MDYSKFLDLAKSVTSDKKKLAITIACCVVAVIIIVFIIYKYKDIKGMIVDKKADQKLVDEVNKSIVVEDITIPQDQFNVYAKKLYRAMKGNGTDEDAIYEVFNAMNSRSDVMQLIKTFGVVEEETLAEWLYDDLNSGEIMHLNSIMASKGINYQF